MKKNIYNSCFLIKSFILLVCFISVVMKVSAQIKWNSVFQSYIELYKDLAIEQMLKHRIPASITLAQGILESGAGKSVLATMGNNHFGIKCHDWTGPTMHKDDDFSNECFRVYSNPRESFEDHSAFLKRSRYQSLYSLDKKDYVGWANGLKACGYATNPAYAQRLIDIIETYKLYQYDNATDFDHFVLNHSVASRDVELKGNLPHQLYYYNKNYYVVARRGDTFETLSLELGVSSKKLAKYNERDKDDVLMDGEVVYLKEKQKRAKSEFAIRPHVVKAGESLYSISQLYGMKLSSLYKMNKLMDDYSISVGDKLIVY